MLFVRPLHPGRLCGAWVSLYPFGPLAGLTLALLFVARWGILTDFQVPVLADTLLSLSRQTTYK